MTDSVNERMNENMQDGRQVKFPKLSGHRLTYFIDKVHFFPPHFNISEIRMGLNKDSILK